MAVLWGQMTTGGGYSPIKETMNTLSVPVTNTSQFTRMEEDIGELMAK